MRPRGRCGDPRGMYAFESTFFLCPKNGQQRGIELVEKAIALAPHATEP